MDKQKPPGSNSLLSSPQELIRRYAVLIMILILMILLSFSTDAFFTTRNLLNILNQNAPLSIIAAALTFVIIGGGFDLSTGAIFSVAGICAAWLATNFNPQAGLLIAPMVGLTLGTVNGVLIAKLKIHSFLATLATGLVFGGIAVLISGGFLIPVRMESFSWLGRGKIVEVNIAIIVFLLFVATLGFLLNKTKIGRYVFAVGGNEEAAILSGINTEKIKIVTFALSGLAAGIAGAISVSRISMGQPNAGAGIELQAIAAVILGGTSIYGGQGAIWRSVAGVMLLALINNGFNMLNLDPFYKDLTTGLIIVAAVALSTSEQTRT